MDNISVRIDEIDQIDFFSKILKENRSETLRTLLDEGKKSKALDLYKKKKVSLGLAAKLSGLTLSEFIDLLKGYNVNLNLELDEVKEAIENADKFI